MISAHPTRPTTLPVPSDLTPPEDPTARRVQPAEEEVEAPLDPDFPIEAPDPGTATGGGEAQVGPPPPCAEK